MNDQAPQNQEKITIQSKQVVVFRLDNEEYAIPIEEVKEVVNLFKITQIPNSPEFILGVINLRGKILPVVDLEKRFHLQRETKLNQENIIIFEDKKGELFGIGVDKVTEVLRVPVDIIKSTPQIVTSKISADFLKGVIVIAGQKDASTSDRILLLLDLPNILDQSILDKVKTTVDDKREVVATPQLEEAATV